MKRWKVFPNEVPFSYTVEADTPEQAIEEAKELWRCDADDLPWAIEECNAEKATGEGGPS